MLKAPRLDGDKLTFDVAVIEGDLGQADGPATVFIDIINLPMARRTAQRSAWYRGGQAGCVKSCYAVLQRESFACERASGGADRS